MAKESIAKFFDAAMTDPALAEKVAALAAENGYEFTAEELLELGSARPLFDSDMGNVSGGKFNVSGGKFNFSSKEHAVLNEPQDPHGVHP